jgi:hypothetical protein
MHRNEVTRSHNYLECSKRDSFTNKFLVTATNRDQNWRAPEASKQVLQIKQQTIIEFVFNQIEISSEHRQKQQPQQSLHITCTHPLSTYTLDKFSKAKSQQFEHLKQFSELYFYYRISHSN